MQQRQLLGSTRARAENIHRMSSCRHMRALKNPHSRLEFEMSRQTGGHLATGKVYDLLCSVGKKLTKAGCALVRDLCVYH